MTTSVAIAGLGAIGSFIASRMNSLRELSLVAVSDRDAEGAARKLEELGLQAVVVPLNRLADLADIVVEALPAAIAVELHDDVVAKGKTLVSLSSGAVIQHPELLARARKTGARIIVPSGAVGGLDALKAAREGKIFSVKMITRKGCKSLAGAPYVAEKNIDLDGLQEATMIFEGSAIEAARAFPANVNVVAAVSMAGLGPEETRIEVWADPHAQQNSHTVVVRSDSSDFEIHLNNFPSLTNPRTSQLASLSVLATLRGVAADCVVGT